MNHDDKCEAHRNMVKLAKGWHSKTCKHFWIFKESERLMEISKSTNEYIVRYNAMVELVNVYLDEIGELYGD